MTAYNELRKGAWGQLGLSRVNPKTPLWSWNDTGKNEHTLQMSHATRSVAFLGQGAVVASCRSSSIDILQKFQYSVG